MAVEWRKIITTADLPDEGAVMGSGNSYRKGLVPAGSATHGATFLRKDGTYVVPTDTNTWTALSGTVSGYVTTQGSSSTSVFLNGNGAWSTPADTGVRAVTAGGNTLAAGETLAFTAGSNVTIAEDAGAVTITGTAVRSVTAGGNTLAAGEALDFVAGTGISIAESGGDVTITNTVSDTNTWVNLSGTVSGYVTTQGSSNTAVFLNGNGAWSTPAYTTNTNTTTTADVLSALNADWTGGATFGTQSDDKTTFTGDIKAANAQFTGDLDVQGTTTTINSANTSFTDTSIQLNVADGELAFGSTDSAIVFGDSTGATSTGRIVKVGTAGFKFTDGNATNTPAGNNNVSLGANLVDCTMKGVYLNVEGSAPTQVAGGIHTRTTGFYVCF